MLTDIIQQAKRQAARGTSEELNKTPFQIAHEDPEDSATVVAEILEPAPSAKTTTVVAKVVSDNLFLMPDAHPFVLDVALLHKYGVDWMGWEPSVLEMKIAHDFRIDDLSQLTIDKIQAVKTLHLVDTFWSSWLVFVPCSMALSGVHAEFRVLTAPTVPQAMIAVDIAAKIRSDIQYGLEVRTFLEVVYLHDGIVCPTEPMTDIVHVDASRYDIDTAGIKAKWEEVRKANKAPEGLTPENVQLQRMLEAHNILEENRKQMHAQLPLVYDD